jgi:signal transduction histidine kinase
MFLVVFLAFASGAASQVAPEDSLRHPAGMGGGSPVLTNAAAKRFPLRYDEGVRAFIYGGDAEFPPYEFVDAAGEPAGLNVDLIRAAARQLGLSVRIELRPWPEVRDGLARGRYDIAAMYRSEQRAQEVDFAIPHELIYCEMFIRKGGAPLASLDDIAKRRVLVQAGTFVTDVLSELGFTNELVQVQSEPEALRALARGDGDVAIVTQTVGRPFEERATLAGQITVSGPPVLQTEYAFVTQRGRRDVVELLNQGMAALKASGEFDAVYKKWIRPDHSAVMVRRIGWVLAIAALVTTLVVLWNYSLRRRVARQVQALGRMDRSYRELEDFQAQIQKANRELEAFAYSVSHDLRAPLRSIEGFSQILLEEHSGELSDDGRRACGIIADNARRMSRLIEDLLNFSRFSRVALEPEHIQMGKLIQDVIDELVTGEARNRVQWQIEPLPEASGDSHLLRQVWINLIGNAVKFSARQEHPTITIAGSEQGAEVRYWIRDNGAGFDMARADQLFTVFNRLHSAREFEGTGVGLAIVKRIIERHGGRVWAESKAGEGATFYFTLPKTAVPASSAELPSEEKIRRVKAS